MQMSDDPDAHETPCGLGWFLFSFRGRIGRGQFWRFHACVAIFAILLAAVDVFLVLAKVDAVVAPVFAVLVAYPTLAVLAKRWHDRDKSAWWVAMPFVPVLGGLWTLVECGFLSGSPAINRFGPPPAPEDV